MPVHEHYGASAQQQARRVPISSRIETSASFTPGKNWPLRHHGSYTDPCHLISLCNMNICKHGAEQCQCFGGCWGTFKTPKSRQGPGVKQKSLCAMYLSFPQNWCISLHGVTGLEKKGTLIKPLIGLLRLFKESWWPWWFTSYIGVWHKRVLVGSPDHT